MDSKYKQILYVLTGLLALIGLAAYGLNTGLIPSYETKQALNTNIGNQSAYERDLTLLEDVEPNFGAISNYFVELAEREGAVYAFEILKIAPMPPNIDLHLLGHVVGDEMYKQEGIDGMQYCTHDFRNACSHTVVIGALLENGLGVFEEVNEVCKKAPGGPGAYTMCFHGFGHGVLAYTEYEMPDAIELCRKVGTDEYHNNEFHQCVGGMVMEMHDGIHDPDVWKKNSVKYLDPDDPLKMCQADYMPDEAKYFCYVYITPFIFDAAGGDPSQPPSEEVFARSFEYCAQEPNERYRKVCYGGLGKEFIVLAQSRDIRNVDQMAQSGLQQVIDWCELAVVEEGVRACFEEAQNSLYWGGENDYGVSITFCSLMDTTDRKSACFEHMIENVSYYERNDDTKKKICSEVPSEFVSTCESVLIQ